ncbi:MAG: hypothetical protein HC868_03655 [Sphingomonadales bacterium]|nr:hypothetical protein [Sphingomonadales bacterium]
MQSLTNPDGHQPDAIRVAHDVNQAMFDVLTPAPVDPGDYDLALIPRQAWSADESDWEMQLTAIFRAVRVKYPVLAPRPSSHDVTATLPVPISFTHQLIVGRIFLPCVRFAPHRGLRAGIPDRRDAMPSLQQVDFDVHRAIVQTLVPRRVAEDAYSVGLKPSSYTACRDHWASDLSDIQGALRRKYASLEIADVKATAAVTYDQPLANTKDRIVEEILGAGVWFPIG